MTMKKKEAYRHVMLKWRQTITNDVGMCDVGIDSQHCKKKVNYIPRKQKPVKI